MPELLRGFIWGLDGSVQEMVVDGGRVIHRGPIGTAGTAERISDCSGRVLIPAFIDNHCHILPTGLDLLKVQLGGCSEREQVLEALRGAEQNLSEGEWLMAVHYDQTKFADSKHIDRWELDLISTEKPILIRHVSGHASVANTAALKAAGIDESEPNPPGGAFVRNESGELTGLLLEDAHERVTAAAPSVDLGQMVQAILAASNSMRELGICAAADMMTGRYDLDLELQAYHIASQRGAGIRFRLYLQWGRVFGPKALDPSRLRELSKSMDSAICRIAGIKIFADGAIGSGTAAIYGKYESNPDGPEDQGQLIYSPERLSEMVRIAHDAGYQVAIHSIGDRSTDHVLEAYEALGQGASRHRIEHAMLLSDAQIDRLSKLGVHVTMQPEFLTRFGHAYLKQLGPERASKLKRMRSVKDAGLRLSLSSDRPIVSGDPQLGVQNAVRRPRGFDQTECLSYAEAFAGYHSLAAEAMEDEFGNLEPGQWADMIWLDSIPEGLHFSPVGEGG